MKNNEELFKECMYGKDIDFEISMTDGSVKYPKPYQLRMKIEDLLDAYKSELVERGEKVKKEETDHHVSECGKPEQCTLCDRDKIPEIYNQAIQDYINLIKEGKE